MSRKYFKNNKNSMDKTMDFYNAVNSVIIENVDYRKIFDNAVQFQYNKPLDEYYENDINAIMINNIRHNCSNYDDILKHIHKIHRCNNDYIQYKNSVLEKISNAYPFLKNECNKQKRIFDMVIVK